MASIDGLGSGLDTTSIITSLMQIERAPQTRLASRRLDMLTQSTTWAGIGTAVQALSTAALGLSTAGQLARTTATSSSTAVGISTSPTTPAGSHTLTVNALATAHVLSSATLASSTTPVGVGALVVGRGTRDLGISSFATDGAASGSFALNITAVDAAAQTATIQVNGASFDVSTSSGSIAVAGLTLQVGAGLHTGTADITVARATTDTTTVTELAASLNAEHGVASAAVVDVGGGSSKLLLTSTKTGAANSLEVVTEGLAPLGLTTLRAGSDASMEFDGLAVTRPENTITDLVPGATLTLQAPSGTTPVSLAVNPDPTASTATVKDLVTSLNGVLSKLATATAYDATTKTSGPLAGNGGARDLTNALRTLVSETTGTAGTPASIGMTLQRDGTYAFDETTFAAALSKDPDGVADLVAKMSTSLSAAATSANGDGGPITTGQDAAGTAARDMQTQVDAYETRLTLTQDRLTRQFSALDSAMGVLKNQGSAITSQLASLPTWSS